jgi:hypothetical protein
MVMYSLTGSGRALLDAVVGDRVAS